MWFSSDPAAMILDFLFVPVGSAYARGTDIITSIIRC